MSTRPQTGSTLRDLGLLAIRVSIGAAGIAHGSQKLFGWFGGSGIGGTSRAMESMGFHPPERSARAAGLAEAGGGALLVLGLGTEVGGAAMAGAMTTAGSVHADTGAGFYATNGGYEYPATLSVVAASLALAGPGRYSLDHATRYVFNQPWMRVFSLAASVGSAMYTIKKRRDHVENQLVEQNRARRAS